MSRDSTSYLSGKRAESARNNHGERAATFCHGQGEDIGSFSVGGVV